VNGRHQALDDVVLLVDHFGQRRQTVGRARRVAGRHASKQVSKYIMSMSDGNSDMQRYDSKGLI